MSTQSNSVNLPKKTKCNSHQTKCNRKRTFLPQHLHLPRRTIWCSRRKTCSNRVSKPCSSYICNTWDRDRIVRCIIHSLNTDTIQWIIGSTMGTKTMTCSTLMTSGYTITTTTESNTSLLLTL
uniref:Uncharacterized protein n=1 Tax=Cacopsylla melanoneura TaxID=428564 RepID=A0A8D8MEY1_9HEMI